MVSCEEAWRRIASGLAPLASERCPRAAALGRVLAAPVRATAALPAVDVSALDGFALAGSVAAGARLPVAGTIAAGAAPAAELTPGRALEIWTGAPLPAGADRVVAVEQVERLADGGIRVLTPPEAGNAIRRAGEVTRPGDELLAAGAVLGPAALSLAASQGLAALEVHGAPRFAFLVTGDEITPAERTPAPGQLRDSHSDFLAAAARGLGLEAQALGRCDDHPERLAERLAPALEGAHVVATCGGVSRGGADHVPAVLERLGCRIEFHGVAVQPGKPLLFARRGATLVFGLPGNPASVMVAFRLFLRPALERLLGREAAFWDDARTWTLAGPLLAGAGRDRFLPARAEPAGRARPLAARGSHDLAVFGRATLLARVRPGDAARSAGDPVEAIDFV
jgi:molybdopterin molybdotransferase